MITGPQPGNETARVHYVYDAWNRLVGVYDDASGNPGSPVARFVYDGLNRRIKKIIGDFSSDDNYYNNLNWQMIEDREGNGRGSTTAINDYVWSLRYVDTPIACLHDGDADGSLDGNQWTDWRRYYLTDANHNVTTTIRYDNSNGVISEGVSRNIYTPYGSVTRCDENWSPGGIEAPFDSPLYAGYFFDHETGLYQVRNRYYDAGLSTWISRDPVVANNLYLYCGDNPTNASDPKGLSPDDAEEEAIRDEARAALENTWTLKDIRQGGEELKSNPWNAINPLSKGNFIHLTAVGFFGGIFEMTPVGISSSNRAVQKLLSHRLETSNNALETTTLRAAKGGAWVGEGFEEGAYIITVWGISGPVGETKAATKVLTFPGVRPTLVWGARGAATANTASNLYNGDLKASDLVNMGFAYAIPARGSSATTTTVRLTGVQANRAAGNAAADAIAIREAGIREGYFETVGGVRKPDVVVLGEDILGIESKVGRTSLDPRIRQELARDWWLRRQGQLDRVRWEFSPNEAGQLGPTDPLLQKLQKLGFEVRINPVSPTTH